MLSARTKFGVLSTLLLTLGVQPPSTFSAASPADACAKIAGRTFVPPLDALACLKSFSFNETLRQNVLQNAARVLDFFSFEPFYINSPRPFQESTVNIRRELARIGRERYATDYDFNRDLYDVANSLNDGHTKWFPDCYSGAFQNLLPAPIVSLEENGVQSIFIAPDAVEFIELLGPEFTDFFDEIKFDWRRLAGARVLSIEGLDPYSYVDRIASTVSGNYLDHGIRVNSVFSSYRISANEYSQRFGDLAGPPFPEQRSLRFRLVPAGSRRAETVNVPYLASFGGNPFTDKESYWANNCAAREDTNGIDVKPLIGTARKERRQPIAAIRAAAPKEAVGLPDPFIPTLPEVDPTSGVVKAYVLPDNTTGVLFVGSFGGDFVQFQENVVSAFERFKEVGVTRLLVDVTNNGGGFVCLGQFLHQYIVGSSFGYPGFVSTNRANPLAQKIVKNVINLGLTSDFLFYAPGNWAFLNDTQYPEDFNYNNPSERFIVNGRNDPTSQRFHDGCTASFDLEVPETAQIPLENVAIVGNGNCASTCALFTTVMVEQHNTKIGVFGGRPGRSIEYKGMAGNQVLEWADLDTEIKSADLKNDPLAPPDLLVSGNFRHNWRNAWSFIEPNKPIAYRSDLPKFRFAYTKDTYNNPQNLWVFAAEKMLG